MHSDGVAQTNTPGQVRLTGLLVNQRVAEYFGEVYTRTSLEDFVFFQGEPITYRVAVQNDQCDAHVHFNLKVARSLMAPLPLRDDPLEIVFTRYGEQVDASIVNAFDQAHT